MPIGAPFFNNDPRLFAMLRHHHLQCGIDDWNNNYLIDDWNNNDVFTHPGVKIFSLFKNLKVKPRFFSAEGAIRNLHSHSFVGSSIRDRGYI